MQKPSMAELSKAGNLTRERTSSAATRPSAAGSKTHSVASIAETPERMFVNAASGVMVGFGLARVRAIISRLFRFSNGIAAKGMDIQEFSPAPSRPAMTGCAIHLSHV
jgi:hypothetical protein